MAPPMHRHPRQHRTAAGHRSHDDKHAAHRRAGRERAMREKSMIADRQPEASNEPHCKKQADFDGTDRAIEQQAESYERTDKWKDVENDKMATLQLVKVAATDDAGISHVARSAILEEPTG